MEKEAGLEAGDISCYSEVDSWKTDRQTDRQTDGETHKRHIETIYFKGQQNHIRLQI